MTKLSVGVLRGGPSSEHEVSLRSGGAVLKNLPEKYRGVDIVVTKEGLWHIDGILVSPPRVAQRVDVVVNALHGEYGEDGKVQKILKTHGIPIPARMLSQAQSA